jgi:outer membrane usher protein FimD/PapC
VILQLEDGSPVPEGARVVLPDGRSHGVARRGEAYLPSLPDFSDPRRSPLLRVEWAGGRCLADLGVGVAAHDEPLPTIGPLTCRAPGRALGRAPGRALDSEPALQPAP